MSKYRYNKPVYLLLMDLFVPGLGSLELHLLIKFFKLNYAWCGLIRGFPFHNADPCLNYAFVMSTENKYYISSDFNKGMHRYNN